MSYIDVLNDAAARADAASTKAEGASQLLEDIANGPVDSYVATLNGQVPTAATAIDDLRNQITAGATAPILESVTLTVDGQTNITFENIQTSGIAVYIDEGGGSYRYFNFTVGGTTSIVLNDNFLAGTVVHGMSQEIGGQVQTAVDQTQANAQLAEDWAILTGETVDGTEYSSKHHAGEASSSASAAAASEQNSASSASDAQGFANDSSNSAVLSKDWATLTTGTVDGAEYSSKYYSQQASSSASSAATSESNAATSESKALTSENAASNSESNALTYSQDALQYRNEAESFSNFVGGWSALTGAKDAPMIAFHNGGYWCLLESVADITSEEPGQSTSWAAFNITRHGGKTYGEDLDGLTFDAMVSRGDYDPSTDTGFFGEVPAATLFTGPEIKTELGITEGTPMNDAEPWLKFWSKGRVLYTNKKPIQHSISWNHIDSRGAAYGTPVTKNGYAFTARLLTGAASDPIDTVGYDQIDSCTYDFGAGSEWNELIYRVHQDEPFCGDPNHGEYHGGPQVGGNWTAMYTNADLGVVTGDGRASWCQEADAGVSSDRVIRGLAASVAFFARYNASGTHSHIGLRLVLALNS